MAKQGKCVSCGAECVSEVDKVPERRVYGEWAGNPGVRENPNCCVEEIWSNYIGRQCTRKRGYGKDGLYCKQHAKRHPADEVVR